MLKKMASVVLSILLAFTIPLPVAASTTAPVKTFKEIVNEMELEPLRPDFWDQDFIKKVDKVVEGKETNYDKLLAVYNSVVADQALKELNCVGYAIELQAALEVIGFRTYHVAGNTKAQGGGWTEHKWVGIDIGNYLYYFDANLPALHGQQVKNCFAIPYKKAPLYADATLCQTIINPSYTGCLINVQSEGIPTSVSKRKFYRALILKEDWPEWDLEDGKIVGLIYPDGTRIPY